MAITKTRYMALEEEASYADETITAPANYIDFIKESFSSKRNLNLQETVGFTEPRSMSVGKYDVGGGVDYEVIPDELGHLLRMLMGAADTSAVQGATAAYLHTWGGPADIIPSYTIAINKDDLLRLYYGSVMKKFVLKLVPGSNAVITADIISAKETIGTKQTPTFQTVKQPLHFTGWDTDIKTVDNVYLRALEYTFERKVFEDDYRRESQFRKGAHARGFKTTIKADLYFEDETQLKIFYDGSTGTEPADEVVPFNITTKVTGQEAATAYDYAWEIITPEVGWDTEKATMDAQKHLIQNLTGVVAHNAAQGSGTKMTLLNLDVDLT